MLYPETVDEDQRSSGKISCSVDRANQEQILPNVQAVFEMITCMSASENHHRIALHMCAESQYLLCLESATVASCRPLVLGTCKESFSELNGK